MAWDINGLRMKKVSLTRKYLTQFTICIVILLLLATPLFYLLTKDFYAEDMIDIVKAVQNGQGIPPLDLERDIIHGVMLQFGLIVIILGIAIIFVTKFLSQRLWKPFYKTLDAIESFRVESDTYPKLEDTDIIELSRLNTTLETMMQNSQKSYKLQKEFTENASHELQTPLAVFQSKLDILMQQPDITENQAVIIQDLYQMNGRLSRLSRNLLLLAKMENKQYQLTEKVDVIQVINDLMPYLESLADGLTIEKDFHLQSLKVKANRSLLESLINNLFVNAVRHNKSNGKIIITVTNNSLTIANTSDGEALDATHIFDRFYRAANKGNGYGLGLAIVKAVCEYHGWSVNYKYSDDLHHFIVNF